MANTSQMTIKTENTAYVKESKILVVSSVDEAFEAAKNCAFVFFDGKIIIDKVPEELVGRESVNLPTDQQNNY